MKRTIVLLMITGLVVASCSSGEASTGVAPTAGSDVATPADTDSDTDTEATDQTEPTVPEAMTVADLFLPNAAAGLDSLTSYHQEMTLTVTGSAADTTDSYVRDAWPGVASSTLTTMTTADGITVLLIGDLGQSTFRRSGADAVCEVRWSAAGSPATPVIEPAAMLPPVVAATESGAELRDGVAATGYTFEAQVGSATGTGELWLADESGVLLAYSLDLVTGAMTQAYRYAVTSIDALGEAALPAGCEPVLESIPAVDGATNVQRLPHALDYSTTAAIADVAAFYEQTMPPLGWVLVGTSANDPARPTLFFENATTQQAASILLEVSDGATWVSVIVRSVATTTTG